MFSESLFNVLFNETIKTWIFFIQIELKTKICRNVSCEQKSFLRKLSFVTKIAQQIQSDNIYH